VNCISCGHAIEAHTSIKDSKQQPEAGCICICLYCGNIAALAADGTLRELNTKEAHAVAGDPYILAVQRARAEVMKKREDNAR